MERIKGILGFGGMRLPMKDGEVVIDEMNRMVDAFLEAGFNYFDTAHGYLQGQSELALRECLARRYPRDRFVLTTSSPTVFSRARRTSARCLRPSSRPAAWSISTST